MSSSAAQVKTTYSNPENDPQYRLAVFDRLQVSGAADQRKLVRWLLGDTDAEKILVEPNLRATITGMIAESFLDPDVDGQGRLSIGALTEKIAGLMEGR